MRRHFQPLHTTVPYSRTPVHYVATAGIGTGRPRHTEAAVVANDLRSVDPGCVWEKRFLKVTFLILSRGHRKLNILRMVLER